MIKFVAGSVAGFLFSVAVSEVLMRSSYCDSETCLKQLTKLKEEFEDINYEDGKKAIKSAYGEDGKLPEGTEQIIDAIKDVYRAKTNHIFKKAQMLIIRTEYGILYNVNDEEDMDVFNEVIKQCKEIEGRSTLLLAGILAS